MNIEKLRDFVAKKQKDYREIYEKLLSQRETIRD